MSDRKSRLEEYDSTLETITKLSEGNPGAMQPLINIVHRSLKNHFYSIYLTFSTLNRLDIRGPYLWNLYNACNNDATKLMILLHCIDHKFITGEEVKKVSQERVRFRFDLGESCFNFDDLRTKLKNKMPNHDF